MKRLLTTISLILALAIGSAGQVSSHTAFRIRFGAALPATCNPATGDVFFKTTATIGAYQCLVANTYTAMGGGTAFSSGGITANVLCKSDGAGKCADSTIIDTGVVVTSTLPWRSADGTGLIPTYSFTNATATGIAQSGTNLYLITPAQSINFNNGASVTGTFNTSSGLFTTYGGSALAGYGFPAIRGVTSQKAETTTADPNVLTFTPPPAVGTYKVFVDISVSSATSGVVGWTLSYTDSNGNAQTNIAEALTQHGTAAPALTFTTSVAGNYHGEAKIDVNNAAAAIVVKWVGGGTIAAKMSAVVERDQ